MHTRRPKLIAFSVTALAAAFLLIGIGGAVANNAMRAQPTAVAVVNIEHAFDNLAEKAAVEAEIRARGERLGEEEQERRERIRGLREDLDVLAPGAQAHREKQDELEREAFELQNWAQFQQQRLQREHILQTERLYRKLTEALGRVAEDEGYDIVLFREAIPRFQAENPQELVAQIQMRKVLHANESVDITDRVIQRMNNAFEAR